MCCRNAVTETTMNASSVAAVGAALDVVESVEFVLRHSKLLSGSVPVDVNVTKLTFAPAT